MRKSNYDKQPATVIAGTNWNGWDCIITELNTRIRASADTRYVLVVECYQGVHHPELQQALTKLHPTTFIDTATLFKPEAEVQAMTYPYLTDDRLFGYRANFSYTDFLNADAVTAVREQLATCSGLVVVYGHAASVVVPNSDLLLYADMARWEIQLRFRRKEICGLGVNNKEDAPSLHYKRGYFVDWNVCDRQKKKILPQINYWIDTHVVDQPKMITGETLLAGLEKTVQSPFRVVPFFDPAPWGGQWMKEVCGLDPTPDNYGWCFDCVPEENSLLLNVAGILFEMPSNNLVFYKTRELLGPVVEARFGEDFPIRFDFLDTMGGGNLSLQVHPTNQYIHDTFGMYYTQDESYYLLDAGKEATVYLGLKTGADPKEMIQALHESQATGTPFDTEKYINKLPARKHDHYLIPAGTIHCSGSEAMVLEISATPSIFTFKLWDWGRLGLDGLPRPINITHGEQVIQWERNTEYVKKELANPIEPIAAGDGWIEERTGLQENEFIETRRHWFIKPVLHHTGNGVNVLNLVEGEEVIVESPTNAFDPFVVHYAETFIIPASVGAYSIRPYGKSEGEKCGTIKAFVRFHA